MVPRSGFIILLFLWSAAAFAGAQEKARDFHLAEDGARRLYAVSAFAHGHRHGYEEGYRVADGELHLGGMPRTIRENKISNEMHYKREYGDKKRFRQGFVYGFIAGYNDSFTDRGFRLPEWSSDLPRFTVGTDLPLGKDLALPDLKVRATFDEGMMEGYRSGATAQVIARDFKAQVAEADDACTAQEKSRQNGYCEGFTQGFLLGVSDRPSLAVGAESGLAQNLSPPQ